MGPDRTILYRTPQSICDVEAIADWLQDRLDTPVTVRDRFLGTHADSDLAEALSESRVLSPFDRETGSRMYGVIQYEERLLTEPERGGGVLYDGQAVQRALNRRLPADEQGLDTLHVIILDRHLATWGDHDGRWHKRIAVLGQPALISVPGLAEAPAKPNAYYKLKQQHALVSGDTPPREMLEGAIDADVLVPDDPRTTDALKGYVLAAIDLLASGEAFCDDPQCRLYNGHRHAEVIQAQLSAPEFCERHHRSYAP